MEINLNSVKDRILYLVKNEGISKRSFYKKTGISNGTLDQKTGLSEENIVKYLSTYPNINPAWLLTGKGSMLLKEGEGKPVAAAVYNEGEGIKDRLISQLEGENRRLIASEARLVAENTELKKENTSLRQENKELIEKKQSYEVKPKPKNTQGVTT